MKNSGLQIPKRLQSTSTAPTVLHRKLRIGSPDSPLERQADAVADQVMCMPEPTVQRKCARCEEDEKKLQRKENGALNSPSVAPPIVHNVLAGSGRPLDPAARSFMEPRFGRDFGDVRIHTGGRAAESADAVNALAYTVGRDVVFAEGQYRPETEAGRRLIAHELGHVVQGEKTNPLLQRNSGPVVSDVTDPDSDRGDLNELFFSVWNDEIERLIEGARELDYGCWCGPGSECEEGEHECCGVVEGEIDRCCCKHDLDYDFLNVSGSTPGPGQVSMFSLEGFARTVEADAALARCLLQPGSFKEAISRNTAFAAQALAFTFFTLRFEIGMWLRANGYQPQTKGLSPGHNRCDHYTINPSASTGK